MRMNEAMRIHCCGCRLCFAEQRTESNVAGGHVRTERSRMHRLVSVPSGGRSRRTGESRIDWTGDVVFRQASDLIDFREPRSSRNFRPTSRDKQSP